MNAITRVGASQKKVLFGETCLLPLDMVVRVPMHLSGPLLSREWLFNVGYKLRLSHVNLGDPWILEGWLVGITPSGLGEPELNPSSVSPVMNKRFASDIAVAKQAVSEVWPAFQAYVIEQYMKGEVSFERLTAFLRKHYRHPSGLVST